MSIAGVFERGLVKGILYALGLIMLAGCVYPIVDTRSSETDASSLMEPADGELVYTITPYTVLTDTTLAGAAFVLTSSDVLSELLSSDSTLSSVGYPGVLIPYDKFVDSSQLQDNLLWLPEGAALPGPVIGTITFDSPEPFLDSAAYMLDLTTMDPSLTYPSVVIRKQIGLDEPFTVRTIDSIGLFDPLCETCAGGEPPICPQECFRTLLGCFCSPFDIEAPE